MRRSQALAGVPVLSPGKHRTPRSGACFMEYASFLAGQRWTDRPRCTHPLLAGLARGVNDRISDEGRAHLVELVPAVIGVVADDDDTELGLDVLVAVRGAAFALPHAAEHRQQALAAGAIVARGLAARTGVPAASHDALDHLERSLDAAPAARAWGEDFAAGHDVGSRAFRRRSAPAMVRIAVDGLAEACMPDPDAEMAELLRTAIADCRSALGLDMGAPEVVPEPVA